MATVADAPAVQEIYRPYVESTAISFETTPPSVQEIQERMQSTVAKFPWLVCEREGLVMGYAYAGPFKSRCAYDWSVESTVYVREGSRGQGVGRELYRALLPLLEQQGALNVIAGIALPNESSVALHERMGFEKVAHFKSVGFKLGLWWDVGYWQLSSPKATDPRPLGPVAKLE